MPRLFTALALPQAVAVDLAIVQGGVPGARWVPQENFHITLRFIGEVDARTADEVAGALAGLSAAPFDLRLKGCGVFGKDAPRSVWIGVEADPALATLAAKIDRACHRLGLRADARRFMPHVTLARLKDADPAKVQRYVEEHGLFATPPFRVEAFGLYSSTLGSEGAVYTLEETYPLTRAAR